MNPDITKVNILVVTTEFFYINTYFIPLSTIEIILYGYIALKLLFNLIYFKYFNTVKWDTFQMKLKVVLLL